MEPAVERSETELMQAVRAPFEGSNPAGIDVAYEDSFQQLKAEIDKIGSASGAADYDQIADSGIHILTNQSKDLTAACYLSIGLFRTRKWPGVVDGVAVCRILVEDYWETMYPALRRMRARKNALQFLTERLADWIEQNPPGPMDRENVEWVTEEVQTLQAKTTELMAEEAPAFSLVQRLLRDALRKLPAPKSAEEPTASSATDAAPVSTSSDQASSPSASATPSSAPSADVGEVKSSADAVRVVAKVVEYLREQQPYDPVAFRLMRAIRFGQLTQLPPAEGGKTKIQPPIPQRIAALNTMLEQGNHEVLAREAEVSFQQSPFHFWLDLQRFLATALENLGTPAKAAYDAVVFEAANLQKRFPGLAQLTFQDGTPFADAATKDWLVEISAGSSEAAVSSKAKAPADLEEDLQNARARVMEGDLTSAIRILESGISSESSRFERRLAAAELCLRGNRPDAARSILEGLDEMIRRYELNVWAPELAFDALRLYLRALNALMSNAPNPDKPILKKQADDIFERLCQIDPAGALAS